MLTVLLPFLLPLQNEAQSEVAKGTRAGKVSSVVYDDSILGLACSRHSWDDFADE
jgi:hypothetical protein